MEDKVIVTHGAALTAKYGAAGLARIKTALRALVAADRRRGIVDRVVYLDNASAMRRLQAPALTSTKDVRGAKAAIDGVYSALKPDYLMILGSTDVVPHQDLRNPAYKAGDDDDKIALGDLPYACDAPYSRDPAKFVGPTRVVGRLPDLTGEKDPSHLLALLKTATKWKERSASAYEDYFGLSAEVWKGSTGLSLDNVFGNRNALNLVPPKGPNFPASVLDGMMHFINCHGDTAVPEFYGQRGNSYPIALTTRSIRGRLSEGTVASAECCFGAQLYDAALLGIDIPICQSYLRQGAYGYLGSTTIAYGPADGNGSADLICQYFLLAVLDGASIGRAALTARQQYVANAAQMDPIDLKTLAQFCLYGDPSIHPVTKRHAAKAPRGADVAETGRFRRNERRAKLKQTGDFLQATKPTAAGLDARHRPAAQVKATLARIAARSGLGRNLPFVPYKVRGAPRARRGAKKVASAPSRYYLGIRFQRGARGRKGRHRVAVVAKEVGGRIVDYCVYYER